MSLGPEEERAAAGTSETAGPEHAGRAIGGQVEPIRQVVAVRCSPEHAFSVFTERMGTWWPVDAYSRAVSEFEEDGVTVAELEFQTWLGGSILEHLSDGRVFPWAEVTSWHPPHEVEMQWRPHSLPEPPTEVTVSFTPHLDGSTVVELEHHGWERLSAGFRAELYDIYARGWITTLGRFEATAEGAPTDP